MRITKYVYVWMVQGDYGAGWDDLTGSNIWKEARADLLDYQANELNPHRMIRRRVLRADFEAGNW